MNQGATMFYLRDAQRFPVACIASLVDDHPEDENQVIVRYAMSVYNDSDRRQRPGEFPYNQERARQIAEGRLKRDKKSCTIQALRGAVKRAVLENIMISSIRPQVIQACMNWIMEQENAKAVEQNS